jgi:hypothetical protein
MLGPTIPGGSGAVLPLPFLARLFWRSNFSHMLA